MPTTSNQKPSSPSLSLEEPLESTPAETGEQADLPEGVSEVSKRLSLLGKLIIPPDPR
jgi:hypothetical protein